MKRIIALFVAMLFAGAAFADMIVPKIGYDFASQHKMEANGVSADYDAEAGISLGADYIHPLTQYMAMGVGFEYQMARALKDYSDIKFNFLPIYVSGIFYPFLDDMKDMKPYCKLNLGYDTLMGNSDYKQNVTLKGGFYWGIGIGSSFKNFVGELLYSTSAGKREGTGATADVTYSKLALNFGYQFNLK